MMSPLAHLHLLQRTIGVMMYWNYSTSCQGKKRGGIRRNITGWDILTGGSSSLATSPSIYVTDSAASCPQENDGITKILLFTSIRLLVSTDARPRSRVRFPTLASL
jgi:hypothetical protein